MYFGSFTREEVDGAKSVLEIAGLAFEIKVDETFKPNPGKGWSGPFALWVRDEHTAIAAKILPPYFENKRRSTPNQSSEPTPASGTSRAGHEPRLS